MRRETASTGRRTEKVGSGRSVAIIQKNRRQTDARYRRRTMMPVAKKRVAQEKMRSAQNLADSEGEGRMVAAGYWRGRMEAFAEIEKGRWSEGGDGPKHDGVPPDLNTDADPPERTSIVAEVAGASLVLLLLTALLVGVYHTGALLVGALPF